MDLKLKDCMVADTLILVYNKTLILPVFFVWA